MFTDVSRRRFTSVRAFSILRREGQQRICPASLWYSSMLCHTTQSNLKTRVTEEGREDGGREGGREGEFPPTVYPSRAHRDVRSVAVVLFRRFAVVDRYLVSVICKPSKHSSKQITALIVVLRIFFRVQRIRVNARRCCVYCWLGWTKRRHFSNPE